MACINWRVRLCNIYIFNEMTLLFLRFIIPSLGLLKDDFVITRLPLKGRYIRSDQFKKP